MRTILQFLKAVFTPRNLFHYDNLLALVIFLLVLKAIGSVEIEFLNPVSDAFSDVELTDIVFSQFNKNDEYREVRSGEVEFDTNIVLVNIGHMSRGEIGDLLNIINADAPAVVGLDAMFRKPKDDVEQDMYFANAIANTPNLVLACEALDFHHNSLDDKYGLGKFDGITYSYSLFTENASYLGYVNMQTEEDEDDIYDEFAICRKFIPEATINTTQDTLHSFAIEIVRHYAPEAMKKLHKRNLASEVINYVGNLEYYDKAHFKAYDWYELFEGQVEEGAFANKIVLLGFLGETLDQRTDEDRFFTPLNAKYIGKAHKDMYGVVVHANIISTVLKGNYIDEMNKYWGYFWGLLLSYLVFAIYRPIYYDYKVWYDGVTKLLGIVVVFLVMTLIGYLFMNHDYEFKFPAAFLGVVLLAGDYLEIYYGLGKNIARKLKRKKY
ncbi:MAG: CHASE2 domain-containing protein [Cyclobacteriaceae bacterium]